MRKVQLAAFLFLVATAAAAQPFTGTVKAIDEKAIDRAVTGAMKAWQIPGAAIAVVKNDRVVYVKGYGVTELGGTQPVTPDTLFQIASTSKAFTTAAMAMLIDEGKLRWDDPVRKHVGYFHLSDPCADSMVTLRDVVSHRTGLRRHDELWDNTPLTREEVVRAMADVRLTKPFRTAYQYQNIMFIAAGEAIASASGISWDDFVKARIFTPLKMTRTVTTDEEWIATADRASGHRWLAARELVIPQKPIDTTTIGSGGAIKSSARDMGNWIRFQLTDGYFDGQRLVSEAALAETKQPHTVIRLENSSRDMNPESSLQAYGLGWVIQDYRGKLLVSHAGSLNGFATHVDLLPRDQTGFVIMLNVRRGIAAIALRNAIVDTLSGLPSRDWNSYYRMLDNKAVFKEGEQKRERAAKRVQGTTPTRPLAAYIGTYTHGAYGTARVFQNDHGLVLEWKQLTLPLTHWHYDTFHAESEPDEVDEQVVFDVDGDGAVRKLTIFGEEFARR